MFRTIKHTNFSDFFANKRHKGMDSHSEDEFSPNVVNVANVVKGRQFNVGAIHKTSKNIKAEVCMIISERWLASKLQGCEIRLD